jgi:hypothetical protein
MTSSLRLFDDSVDFSEILQQNITNKLTLRHPAQEQKQTQIGKLKKKLT